LSNLKVNQRALKLVENLLDEPDKYNVNVITTREGPTIVDAGVEAKGGYLAGKVVTEICLGGYGTVDFCSRLFGDLTLPSIQVYTDHPVVATLGSQYAGWRIRFGEYGAICSGPARALSLKPKELYAKIGYRDHSDRTVVVLETSELPNGQIGEYIADACGVRSDGLYIIVASTMSVVGSIQVSGRIVETGLHKLVEMGYNPKNILSGQGVAPIAPVHPKFNKAMGRTNDMILYGGIVYLTVEDDDEEKLKKFVDDAPSSSSKDYGRPFTDIFKAAGHDFYKIDPALFAPAVVMVNNLTTGRLFRAGRINVNLITKSISS
jgi:methenyltetrahydromethanopterin cyclohydrolase